MGLIPFIGKKRTKEEIEKDRMDALESRSKAENLPKVFDYYCPGCLFQTNTMTDICPECNKKKLMKTKSKFE
jgi:hypothetical protein